MSMRMTAEDLMVLAGIVRKLEESELDVRKAYIQNHDVYLETIPDRGLVVRGITDKTEDGEKKIPKREELPVPRATYGR